MLIKTGRKSYRITVIFCSSRENGFARNSMRYGESFPLSQNLYDALLVFLHSRLNSKQDYDDSPPTFNGFAFDLVTGGAGMKHIRFWLTPQNPLTFGYCHTSELYVVLEVTKDELDYFVRTLRQYEAAKPKEA
jgi:hypothetical protein